MHRIIAPMPAFIAACATSAPGPTLPRATAPDPASIASFFDALKAQDAAKVEQLLVTQPELAATRRADGTSAVLVALFARQGEGFVRPQQNRILASILARRPMLNPFEAAAVGDVSGVSAALERDPQFARALHPPPIGWTALHFASFGGQLGVIELLLARGANINALAETKFRNTPLQVGLLSAQVEVAQMLVARGADVNIKQAENVTALHEAAQLGSETLVELLLNAGAEVNVRSGDGRTPLDVAVKANHSDAAALLRRHGGNSASGS